METSGSQPRSLRLTSTETATTTGETAMNTPAERDAGHGPIHLVHQVLGEDPAVATSAAGPAPQAGLRWIDPAVEPCLHALAPFGRFVFYGSRGGKPGTVPVDAAPPASGQAVQDADPVLDTIEKFVTGVRAAPSPDRFLGTVLFVDVAESTKLAAEVGDSRFRDLLTGFIQLVRRQVDRYQGRLVGTAGDGALALFDSPARAIGCAKGVRDGVRALGLSVRAGMHTGEMEHGPAGDVRGIAVHTGARVAGLAGPGEILVSRTIRDLVAGAPIRLESRGFHELKGVPGSWEIFAVLS
jgi:class 3 adenylate cyclase